METSADLYRQALEVIRKNGAGSAEYADFLEYVRRENLPLPHGVTLPRYVPGDIRGLKKKKSRKGGREVKPAGESPRIYESHHEALKRRNRGGRKFKSFSSFCEGDKVKESSQMIRTVSETLLIEGLQPVVITRQHSIEDEESERNSMSQGVKHVEGRSVEGTLDGCQHEGRVQGKTQSMDSMPSLQLNGIDETCEDEESQELREVVDQFKAVLMQKAKVEEGLTEEQKRNASLRDDYLSLERQHEEMKTEQEMMNEQVAQQLQHLLKEKSQLMEKNIQLQQENDNLKKVLDLAAASADDSEDEYWEKAQFEVQDPAGYSLHEISAWHPSKSPGDTFSGDVLCFPDENDMAAEPVGSFSGKLDRIAISS